MSNLLRSVRSRRDGADKSPTHYRTMENDMNVKAKHLFRSRSMSSRIANTNDPNYVETTPRRQLSQKDLSNNVFSPTSPSSPSSRYHLMEEQEEREKRQERTTMDKEKIQQGLHRVQRQVSDSWRNLQGASKRLVTRRSSSDNGQPATVSQFLEPAHAQAESRQDVEETSRERRFLRKAVSNLKKNWVGQNSHLDADDGMDSVRSNDGFIRQKSGGTTVIFAPSKDMVAA